MRKCPRCGLVRPGRSVRCECGFIFDLEDRAEPVMSPQLKMAIELLQLSRSELADTIRDELLSRPILDAADDVDGTVYRFEVFADYHQFYVWDAGVGPSAPTDYTDEDLRNRLKVAPNVVVIQPMRNMTVPVELTVCASDPGVELSRWDHVAECSLDLPTGRLQVHECTGGAVLELSVDPGTYRLRAHFGALGSRSDDGLEGADHYRIVLWREPLPTPLKILKQWEGEIDAG
jgi:hypothetical protein